MMVVVDVNVSWMTEATRHTRHLTLYMAGHLLGFLGCGSGGREGGGGDGDGDGGRG